VNYRLQLRQGAATYLSELRQNAFGVVLTR